MFALLCLQQSKGVICGMDIVDWCLALLSAIFQLYLGCHFSNGGRNWSTPKSNNPTYRKSRTFDKLYHITLYQSTPHHEWEINSQL
jgi:hypothetical protein